MADVHRQFSSKNGRFVRFEIRDQKFVILRGKGGEVTSRDIFPLKAAKVMVYDILGMTQEHKKKSRNTARVDQALNTGKQMDSQQAERHIRDVIRNTKKNDKLAKVQMVMDDEVNIKQVETKDIEKVKEQVVDLVYDQFGESYFVSAQFSSMYSNRWDRGNPRWWLKSLFQDRYLVRSKVEDVDQFHGNTKYKYKLSKKALSILENNRMASNDNPGWQYKKQMLPEKYRPKND